MKKILFIIALIITMVFNVKVQAKDCTGLEYAPPMPQITPYYQTRTYDLYTSYSACKGPNAQVYFSSFEKWTEQALNGVIYVDLYEDDEPPNEDDLVKKYKLQYYGDGYLSNVTYHTFDEGNIDSEGDQKCELFLRMYSSGHQGATTPANLFKYQICMI